MTPHTRSSLPPTPTPIPLNHSQSHPPSRPVPQSTRSCRVALYPPIRSSFSPSAVSSSASKCIGAGKPTTSSIGVLFRSNSASSGHAWLMRGRAQPPSRAVEYLCIKAVRAVQWSLGDGCTAQRPVGLQAWPRARPLMSGGDPVLRVVISRWGISITPRTSLGRRSGVE